MTFSIDLNLWNGWAHNMLLRIHMRLALSYEDEQKSIPSTSITPGKANCPRINCETLDVQAKCT